MQVLADGTAIQGFELGLLTGGSGADTFAGGALNDTLQGAGGNDVLRGEDGADLLDGNDGADSLDGGAGADTLAGGPGNDTLSGGADPDRFRFDSATTGGLDRVADLAAADSLAVSRPGFSIALVSGGPVSLIGGTDPQPLQFGPVFLYDTDTGLLAFDADGTGATAALTFVELLQGGAPATLTAGQILVL
jgi:Ca2+-binding RTX toxin-like protein